MNAPPPRFLTALALCLLAAGGAAAQGFPDRPIRLVIPQPPGASADVPGRVVAQKLGSAPDVLAQILAQKLGAKWGKPIVVENRRGAGGNIGADFVAKAAPDGHTWLLASAGAYAINATLYPRLPFDPAGDFTAVATLASVPYVLVANGDLPVTDVASFVALAKRRPGDLNYGAPIGSVNHLLGVMLDRAAGVSTVPVPYRTAADALEDTVSGVVQFNFASVPAVVADIRAGKVRALAVASPQRARALPAVPTLAEAGVPGVAIVPWFGILVPTGTPARIVREINAAINEVLALPDVGERLAAIGAEPLVTSPERFAQIVRDDIAAWRAVVKASGAKVE